MVAGADGGRMTAERLRPPDPAEAGSTAEFVGTLALLRQWAGEPSLSRLRALGGQTTTSDGTTVDALPRSTTSYVLRQGDRLPRWDFVRAFVTACFRYCDYPAELIPEQLERWRAARTALAGPAARTPETPGAPAGPAEPADVRGEDPAVELLARRVLREEDRARKGLLGGYTIASLSFSGYGDDGEAEHDLLSIGRYFSGLRPQRLLVVGESGAGKTVLAIELVLQLLEPVLAAGGRPDQGQQVPVRLNAARWTLGRPFEPWLAEQLAQDFGLAAKDARRLVRDRRVLPVVDGLDELDPEPSPGPPRRAIGLLAELNRYSDLSGRRPGTVVVTCRADRHAQLRAAGAVLDNAARIHLHNLTGRQIGAYLRARWPDGHPCAPHRDAVHAALSGPAAKAVHLAVATPWRLLLTVTAVESGADPVELLRTDPGLDPADGAAKIARRLLKAYVPAATVLTPRADHGTPYQPDQVRSWLVHLAAHLRRQAARGAGPDRPPPGLTAIDIVPHLLWPIGGRRLVRVLHCLGCAVFAVIAMLAFWAGSGAGQSGSPADPLTLALMAGWVAIAICLSLSPWPAAAGGRSEVPRRRRVIGGLLGALGGLPAGVLGGLAGFVLTGGRVFGPVFAVAAGGAGGLALGVVIGLTAAGRRGAERMTVSEAIRAEPLTLLGFGLCGALTGLAPLQLAHAGPLPLAAGVSGAFVLAFALGIAFKIATGGWSRDTELAHPREALRRNPVIGLAFGLTGGVAALLVFVMTHDIVESLVYALIGGVTFGLAFGAVAWARTMIGLVVAATRGLLPLRLWAFLDWACEARLLRVSGATYQFRHREFQDFLTPSDDEKGSSPPR
ncbi:NACHT domain-containing protein [Nonomuraea sp. KC401]|uniref:NACHT domain-containing protein n=1 Tax=unclassified Nonomuraea TaxID=2593643 RepID=UPI0010FF2193|nr:MULTISPECIES: NACHT domain-containing protein [unclassified Nonomuraea]NBE93111.1 NACHT domain-containing protein [Nonomuraea sp. K271]TLF80332.1 NACHT domain-containing protein [Nonomuraea sp. KC401]